ncbi:MAG TPA: heparinase II/III family protein, partial [Gemmatimonadaceae bacterium]
AALIAEYDEGTSNRQAWNVAALFASARLLGREREAGEARENLDFLLHSALLADGSWYEGENYHVFAHRGLWYGVTMAERAGASLDRDLAARFDRGFSIPFRTALPDFTMLARRDSQHAISLRQWRFAELCELGLARADDPELRAALARLYEPGVPRHDTGRARSAAEAERHSPASGLDRSDLGWRSLLHALPTLPALAGATPRSVLLPTQGLAVFRRDAGRLFVAVDYGESGGGHGHPDRLNLVLADGDTRWLDDPGTGSYVDRSLHWYRSTLAHCAPLAGRASQPRRAGGLLDYEERGGAGWVRAGASLAPGVVAERRVAVMDDYVVDELSWVASGAQRVGLPVHLDADAPGIEWRSEALGGAGGLEDGFDFVESAEVSAPEWPLRLRARSGAREADVWLMAPRGARLWRLVAPGPPGDGPRPFLYLESDLARGVFVTVLAPRRTLAAVELRDASVVATHRDGTVHEHSYRGDGWRIDLRSGAATSSIELGGAAPAPSPAGGGVPGEAGDRPRAVRLERDGAPVELMLGEREYRRSEQSWRDAGSPTARIVLRNEGGRLRIGIQSRTGPPVLIADDAVNEMDNESPDVNASGVQIFTITRSQYAGWLVRPATDGVARVRALAPDQPPIDARAEIAADGWRAEVAIDPRRLRDAAEGFHLAVVVNEIPPGRERRRGQLVLGGRPGGWVYLRGDRHQDLRESIRVELA